VIFRERSNGGRVARLKIRSISVRAPVSVRMYTTREPARLFSERAAYSIAGFQFEFIARCPLPRNEETPGRRQTAPPMLIH